MDLYQGLLDDTHTQFTVADYHDIIDCEIVVITASVPYNPEVNLRQYEAFSQGKCNNNYRYKPH